ncbi:MAG TPA: tryptophan synthase subunit alpha [Bacteroidota bacterium]|nr:tryptophan synthase subunit alpha [Bacteroidota bacterium]
MTSLESKLNRNRVAGRKILSVFITAGLPSPEVVSPLVRGLADAGADIVELGVPFSDPIADGPVIQASSSRALRMGVTPSGVFSMVREIRKITDIPVILMGYANPFLSYGLDACLRDAASAGVDGMIVPDLPPEESASYRAAALAAGVSTIFLVAPTTPDERIGEIDGLSTGFVYGVATIGVTGARDHISDDTLRFLRRARRSVTRHPLLAGFGIADPASARAIASLCDGVIVGSAVVSRLGDADPAGGIRSATDFTASLRRSLDS